MGDCTCKTILGVLPRFGVLPIRVRHNWCPAHGPLAAAAREAGALKFAELSAVLAERLAPLVHP